MLRLFALLILSVYSVSAQDARPRVVILGDSLAEGVGLDPSESFPAVLQTFVDGAGLSFQVVNGGVSGDSIVNGLQRLPGLLEGGAAVLVIELGGNDGLRGRPTGEIEAGLLQLVTRARDLSPGIPVLIAGMHMPRSQLEEYRSAYAAIFPKVAKQTGSKDIPDFLKGVGGVRRLNQADGIHPTAEGQRVLAENVWKVLFPVLKKISSEKVP